MGYRNAVFVLAFCAVSARGEAPVASPSGGQIASVRDGGDRALAYITISSPAGKTLHEIAFRLVEDNVIGMRGVDQLEWLSEQRLMVAGSVNPSSCEYAVVDVSTGKEVDWYSADGFSLVASPDGKHVAYEGEIVEPTQDDDRRPRFCINHECDDNAPAWPGPARHVEFVTNPAWSPSGATVAIVAQDYRTKKLSLVVRSLRRKPAEQPLPLTSTKDLRISWTGETASVSVKP